MIEIVVSNGTPWFVDRAPDGFTLSLRPIDIAAIETLAANLAIGAALCRAHHIGEGSGYEWATRKPFWPRWEPGCGHDATRAETARKQPGAFADIYGDRARWRIADIRREQDADSPGRNLSTRGK